MGLTQELLEQFKSGNRTAFDTVYNAYSRGMYAICLRYTRCDDDAQDVLQETFIRVYNNCKQYDVTKPFGAWIKTITVNSALTYIKQNYRFELHDEDHIFDEQQEFQLEEENEQRMKQQLMQLLQQLPDGYRTVFNLFVIDNLTHKEIAAHLGITESTSKTQYFKAKRMLQQLLQNEKVSA